MHPQLLRWAAGAAVALSLFGVVGVAQASSLTSTQVSAIVSLLQSFGASASVVANVQATLNGQSTTGTNTSCISLSYNLYAGMTDSQSSGEVSQLQSFLGVSPTGYFGPMTQEAVQTWQSSHSIVSSGSSDTTGYGFVGPKTRDAMGCGEAMPYVLPVTTTTQASSDTPTATIQTYTNTQYGFSIGYQAGVNVKDYSVSGATPQFNPSVSFEDYANDASDATGMTDNIINIPIPAVGNSTNGSISGEVSVSMSTNPTGTADCMNTTPVQTDIGGLGTNEGTVSINGITFTHFNSSSVSGPMSENEDNYRVLQNGACWSINLITEGILGSNGNIPSTYVSQIESQLNADLQTFEFLTNSTDNTPTATINQSSLNSLNSANPVITGTATNASQVLVSIQQTAGTGSEPASGEAPIVNGQWSYTVPPSVLDNVGSAGENTFQISVSVNGLSLTTTSYTLTTGTLTITSSISSGQPQVEITTQGNETIYGGTPSFSIHGSASNIQNIFVAIMNSNNTVLTSQTVPVADDQWVASFNSVPDGYYAVRVYTDSTAQTLLANARLDVEPLPTGCSGPC
jgi:hypothetical protein